MNTKETPTMITSLQPNEVFVFGSNLGGQHLSGAAKMAFKEFGAEWGAGVGMTGQCYAIPTMQGGIETIRPYIDKFIEFAMAHQNKHFLVTKIGCGIAGFTVQQIATLFAKAVRLLNVSLPKEFYQCLSTPDEFNLQRFLDAQDSPCGGFKTALEEMENGGKTSHWIWYIFPQFRGLGTSGMSIKYAINSEEEALAYINHSVLGARLRQLVSVILEYPSDCEPQNFMGSHIDAQKLKSCMTLFDYVCPDDIFEKVLDKFFGGQNCYQTMQKLMWG